MTLTVPAALDLPLWEVQTSPLLRQLIYDTADPILLRAANGAGKTYTCCYRTARIAVENPGSHHRFTGPSRAQVRKVSGKYFWDLLQGYLDPASRWTPGIGWNRNNTIVLANGSTIELRSYEDPPGVAAGAHDLMTNTLDEPPKPHVFRENRGRGQLLIAATMVEDVNPIDWLREEVEGPVAGRVTPSTAGRHVMERTGWTQYVIPLTWEQLRHIPKWRNRETFETSHPTLKHRGTIEEPQRIWAAWEGVSEERRFTGWSNVLRLTQDQVYGMLRDEDGKLRVDAVRYGLDHGSGDGKQCQYVILVKGTDPRTRRFIVASEYVGGGSTTPTHNAEGMALGLERWLGEQWYLSPKLQVFGDINSSGPAGAGASLNQLTEQALATYLGMSRSPVRIQTPTKHAGWKDAREIAMNHAMMERRWFVLEGACPRAERAYKVYRGKSQTDPEKDPIDAQGYAVQDLLLTVDEGSGRPLLR